MKEYAFNLDAIIERLGEGTWTRFVAFGSSNTERYLDCVHWLDWLELGVKHSHGRIGHFINAGLGGDTSDGLLGRFDDYVALYQPNVVIITIGGNDAGAEPQISAQEFTSNIRMLIKKTLAIGAYPVLQTYYAQALEQDAPERAERFIAFMEIIRDTARRTESGLINHLARWEALRENKPKMYADLMLDPHHVNALGNEVLGIDLMRAFQLDPIDELLERCEQGVKIQHIMDNLVE